MSVEARIDSSQSLPGDFAIWIFIFAELLVFGILFAAFALARSDQVELFNAAQQTLNHRIGLINTMLLLTSGYCVARSTQAIKAGHATQCGNWLISALGLGALFLGCKLFEFHQDALQGISLESNLFYMFYLTLTFFHFMHVLLGMTILAVIARKAYAHGYSASNHTGVETGASYWHMVDLVWVILFALVYVIH